MPDNRSPVPVTLATAANDLLRRLNVTWRRAASRLGSYFFQVPGSARIYLVGAVKEGGDLNSSDAASRGWAAAPPKQAREFLGHVVHERLRS